MGHTQKLPHSGHELQSIQILRGVAAMLVVCRHVSLEFDNRSLLGEMPFGAIGVDIFFPISGMVIYLTAPTLTWKEFLIRRILRVAPMYWLATITKVAAAILVPAAVAAYAFDAWHLLASLFFIPAVDAGGRPFPPIALGWTLNFEMYFYLLSTLMLAVFRSYFGVALSLAICAGVGAGMALSHSHSTILQLLHPIALEFAMGVAIAFLWIKGVRTPVWLNVLLVAIALAAIYCFPDVGMFDPLRPLKWGLPSALIVWSVVMFEGSNLVSRFPVGKLLGDASYSIYIIHPLVLPMLAPIVIRLVDPTDGLAFFLLFASAILVGLIVHLLVERPINRFFRWRFALSGASREARNREADAEIASRNQYAVDEEESLGSIRRAPIAFQRHDS